MPRSKKITLKSSDGEEFRVGEAVASLSQLIKHVIEDVCVDEDYEIPLPNVTGNILGIVVEYCEKHVDGSNDLEAWDADFVKVDLGTLFDIMLVRKFRYLYPVEAANYLDIKSLVDLTCQTVADMMKGRTPEEIRKTLNIKSDFTPEEEEEVRRENQWAFE